MRSDDDLRMICCVCVIYCVIYCAYILMPSVLLPCPFVLPRQPVDLALVPDYAEIIQEPVDLTTIHARLQEGTYYKTKAIFAADLQRMVDNCRKVRTYEGLIRDVLWRERREKKERGGYIVRTASR